MADAKPQVKPGKIEQVADGKPYRYRLRKDGTATEYTVCCDCSLTHMLELKPGKNSIRVRVWREDEITDELRENPKRRNILSGTMATKKKK